jgi:hypothetical protein
MLPVSSAGSNEARSGPERPQSRRRVGVAPSTRWAKSARPASTPTQTGEWRVEYFDDDGGCYVTVFAGPRAEKRARDYAGALRAGGAQVAYGTGD